MPVKIKRKKKKAPKSYPITDKQVKKHKLTARCMKCQQTAVPTDASIVIHKRKSEAGKEIISFRLSGVCNDACGTGNKQSLSRMIGKDQAVKLAKGG